ncbi:MAG: DUF1460 domain-containing protein [Tannerella sp.]|jgi:hypothetical protein|nr:DUF1460 domain-containing protein [Tannerella sp.]
MLQRDGLFFLLLLFTVACKGQAPQPADFTPDFTPEDRALFERYLQATETKATLPSGDLIIETARFFMETPYAASTLEKEPERLTVNLREMDCTTFVETCIALARTRKAPNPSFELFCDHLRQLRYRDGVIRDYTDRLHYFSDWLYENERKGFVRDMTLSTGGKPRRVNVSFMSAHPDRYPALQSHPERVQVIRRKEREITARNGYAMIPEADVAGCSGNMRNGDIVCFVTSLEGLDIAHLGFIHRKGNATSFIHASSSAKKVIAEPRSLQQYVHAVRTTVGLMIVRPE